MCVLTHHCTCSQPIRLHAAGFPLSMTITIRCGLTHHCTCSQPIRLHAAGFPLTITIRAEMVTLRAALNHLRDHPHQPSAPITICSDSQSALATLREGPASQKTLLGAAIWTELAALAGPSRRIHLQWVPSHCGVDENERADQIAKEATALPQAAVPVDVATRPPRGRQTGPRPHHRRLAGGLVPDPDGEPAAAAGRDGGQIVGRRRPSTPRGPLVHSH
ncbi:hypothetical protein FJT64_015435 [Amphibalanus amphitrite]|uniref:RNase H type-1 domain-containing protein n=1 Tax=Amphibalanus amphitrite TaxID=1232801 RepID=A0A6A4X770_AMPAM|nr:hypothetical protein FJT64_015435 [Amphibalanus amphitrite]